MGEVCSVFSVGLGQSAKTNILIIGLISEDGIVTRGVVALSRHRRVLDAHWPTLFLGRARVVTLAE